MSWSFAIINKKLAEVYFDKKGKGFHFWGHVFVKKSEYPTKQEQKWIEIDTKRTKLSYQNEKYTLLF